jgi:hypothetical protein
MLFFFCFNGFFLTGPAQISPDQGGGAKAAPAFLGGRMHFVIENMPIGLVAGISAVLFLMTFGIVNRLRRNWPYVSFSPHKFKYDLEHDKFVLLDEQIDFEPRLGHYLKTTEVVITLASASLVFIPQLKIGAANSLLAVAMASCGAAVFYLVFFMVLLLYFYEDSLYAPASYTVKKSALIVACGVTGLLCFVGAYLAIAFQAAKFVGK